MDKKNIIIILLGAAIIIITSFFIYRINQLEEITKMNIRSNQLNRGGKEGRKQEDPYIADAVKNTIIKKASEIQNCYNKYIETNPEKTDGIIKIDWQITSDGETISPEKVFAEFGDNTLFKCITNRIKTWQFPPPDDGLKKYIVHKFKFKKQ